MPQDAVGAFIVAHIALARLEYPLPSPEWTGTDEENAMLACGQIYYWANRSDIDWNERKQQCQPSWSMLLKHELDEAAARQKSFMVRLNLKCNLKPSLRGNIQRRIMRLLCYDSIIGSKFQAALPNAS
jgi:hypothetical protein